MGVGRWGEGAGRVESGGGAVGGAAGGRAGGGVGGGGPVG